MNRLSSEEGLAPDMLRTCPESHRKPLQLPYLNVVDSVLHCSGLKGMNEEEADQQLGKVIIIFKYLQVRHCPIIMS